MAVTALALGLIGVGTANHDVTSQLVDTLIQRSEAELKDTQCRFIAFAIGLMYLGEFGRFFCYLKLIFVH